MSDEIMVKMPAGEWVGEIARRERAAFLAGVREALRSRIATLERERDEAYERGKADGANEERALNWTKEARGENARIATLEAALTAAERKLSAYVGVCAGDKELTESVLPKVRAALRGVEGK